MQMRGSDFQFICVILQIRSVEFSERITHAAAPLPIKRLDSSKEHRLESFSKCLCPDGLLKVGVKYATLMYPV